jgi:hypothetical protein
MRTVLLATLLLLAAGCGRAASAPAPQGDGPRWWHGTPRFEHAAPVDPRVDALDPAWRTVHESGPVLSGVAWSEGRARLAAREQIAGRASAAPLLRVLADGEGALRVVSDARPFLDGGPREKAVLRCDGPAEFRLVGVVTAAGPQARVVGEVQVRGEATCSAAEAADARVRLHVADVLLALMGGGH